MVIDNLNTHGASSRYKTFPPEKARGLCERFEFHHTPAHGSWLNMAEIEIGLLTRGCLDLRIATSGRVLEEVKKYLVRKNANSTPIKWQFGNEEAPIKLHSIYPSF